MQVSIKQGSTHFLRLVILFLGIVVLALSIFALPAMWSGGSSEFPTASLAIFLIMIGLYVTMVPFFFALWQTLNLLKYIDQNKAFSTLSMTALKNIKYCAITIAVLYIGGIPLLFPIAQADDAPGLIIFGAIIACAPIVVAVFASVMQRLLQQAIKMKTT